MQKNRKIYTTLFILFAAITAGTNYAWGNSVASKNDGSDISEGQIVLNGNHVKFYLPCSEWGGECYILGTCGKGSSVSYPITWQANIGCNVTVTNISFKLKAYNSIVRIDRNKALAKFNGGSEVVVGGNATGTGGNMPTFGGEGSYTSGCAIEVRDPNSTCAWDIKIINLSITYTVTPESPGVNEPITETINVSLDADNKSTLSLDGHFSTHDHFDSYWDYTFGTDGNPTGKGVIDGDSFYAYAGGSYKVYAFINALDNCHVQSPNSTPLTINVNRFNPTGTVSTTTGEVSLTVTDKNYVDLRSFISNFVGDDAWDCQITGTTAAGGTSKGAIDNGYLFYGTQAGEYTIHIQTQQTDRYEVKDFGNVTITVLPKADPVFTPTGFSANVTNAVTVNDALQLNVKNVSDGLSGNGFTATWDSQYFSVTRTGNTITIQPLKYFNTAQAVTFTQVDNAYFNAGSVTYTFTAERQVNTLAWTPASAALSWNDVVSATVTGNISSGAITYSVSDASLGYYDAEAKEVHSYFTNGTLTVTASQEQTDQVSGTTVSTTFTIGAQTESCQLQNVSKIELSGTAEQIINLVDKASSISFQAHRQTAGFNGFYVEENSTGGWNKLADLELPTDYAPYGPYTIPEGATQLRFRTTGTLTKYVKDINIIRRPYITVSPNEVTLRKIKGEEAVSQQVTVHYSTCNAGESLSAQSSLPEWITVTPASAVMTANSGDLTFTVTYAKCIDVTNHDAILTFFNQGQKATLTVHGQTIEVQHPTFTCNLGSEYLVGDEALDLQALWTSNNTYDNAKPQYTCSFIPDGGNHEGATTPAITDNRYLSLDQAGTLQVTMTQPANDFYYAKTDTKDITISRRDNTATVTFNFMGEWPTGDEITIHLGDQVGVIVATTNSEDEDVNTPIDIQQDNSILYGTYYPIEANGLGYVNATATAGDVHLTVNQAQSYKYEALPEQTITVHVTPLVETPCYIAEQAEEFNLQDTTDSQPFAVMGTGDKVECTIYNTYGGTFYVEYTTHTDGTNWMPLTEPQALATSRYNAAANYSVALTDENTKFVRFHVMPTNTTFRTYIRDFHVTRKTFLRINNKEVNDTVHLYAVAGMPGTYSFEVEYSMCDANPLRAEMSNTSVFALNLDEAGNIDLNAESAGTKTVTVTYTPTGYQKDTTIIAIYNRSIKRRVVVYAEACPFTYTGTGVWSDESQWLDSKKPTDANQNVLVTGHVTTDTDVQIDSITVLPGGSLTIGNGYRLTTTGGSQAREHYGNTCVQAGASLDITGGTYHSGEMALYGGWYGEPAEGKNGVPHIYIAPTANLALENTDMYYYLNVNFDNYYPLAVPFPSHMADIRYVSRPTTSTASIIGSAIDVCRYDGEQRGIENTSSSERSKFWVSLTKDEMMQPSVGYAIAAKKLKGEPYAALRLTLQADNAWTTAGEQATIDDVYYRNRVAVGAWGTDQTAWYNRGWNYIANPYLSRSDSTDNDLHFAQGDIPAPEGSTNPSDKIRYVTTPTPTMDDYIQTPLKTTVLEPFWGFFIQAGASGEIEFAPSARHAVPTRLAARAAKTYPEQEAYLSIRNEDRHDVIGLLIDEAYSTSYDINADLVKMLGNANSLRAYMEYGNMNMAFLALNEAQAGQAIPVAIRVPATGEYTWSLEREGSVISHLETLTLTDRTTSQQVDLLTDSYTFTAPEGICQGRFFLNAKVNPNPQPTDWQKVIADRKEAQKVIYRNRLYIIRDGRVYDGQGQHIMNIQ